MTQWVVMDRCGVLLYCSPRNNTTLINFFLSRGTRIQNQYIHSCWQCTLKLFFILKEMTSVKYCGQGQMLSFGPQTLNFGLCSDPDTSLFTHDGMDEIHPQARMCRGVNVQIQGQKQRIMPTFYDQSAQTWIGKFVHIVLQRFSQMRVIQEHVGV